MGMVGPVLRTGQFGRQAPKERAGLHLRQGYGGQVGEPALPSALDYGLRGQTLAGLSLRASQGCSGSSRVSFVKMSLADAVVAGLRGVSRRTSATRNSD